MHPIFRLHVLILGSIFSALLLVVLSSGAIASGKQMKSGLLTKYQFQKKDGKGPFQNVKCDSSSADFFPTIPLSKYDSIFAYNSDYLTDGFDFPVGKPNARNYYKAQEFGNDQHLGEDWNGIGGGNTDLGDPVFAIANGLVTFSKEVCCGWGNVIRVVHKLPEHPDYQYVESVYAHLHNRYLKPGQLIKRGEQIGTIGNDNGRYTAHLHFEIRDFINMSLGPGYSDDTFGFLIPTDFIQGNRPR